MGRFIYAVFFIYILSIWLDKTKADAVCGDWDTYKDEKCIKVFDKLTLQTHDDAEQSCLHQDNASSLVSIHSLEEQEFLTNLLFETYKVVDSAWIGAKNDSKVFKWSDDSDLSFTNWAQGSPSKTVGNNCVQIIAEGTSKGKWIDVNCGKKNLVVCQKPQTWTLSSLQKAFIELKKELENNPIPVGFIYVQLSDQPVPKNLWPKVEWKDITSEYAGLFFRAEGGKSEPFGKIQNASAPDRYIDKIGNQNGCGKGWGDYDLPTNAWSDYYETGLGSGNCISLRFHTKTGDEEVRPINKAVRIWKRIN